LQLKETDHVYLVSDISRLMLSAIKKEGGFRAGEFISSFRNELPNGNLFIPGFVNTLTNHASVDMKSLKPETGGLSKEAFSQFKKGDCVRTNDPFHSFFIYGKDGEQIVKKTMNNRDTFSHESVFGYLHQHQGVLIIIDLSLYFGFTFAHYVEQQMKVHYRAFQSYQFNFTDILGNNSSEIFKVYAKKRGYIPTLNGLEVPLIEMGALQKFNFNGIPLLKIDLAKAYDVLKLDILNNRARNIIDFNLPLYLKQSFKKITQK
jgi:aminoglycoside 3-N-acetyltransferase